jgi:hypothetical protein
MEKLYLCRRFPHRCKMEQGRLKKEKSIRDMREPKIIGVIPARYKSTRFPGKPLADICGKPMKGKMLR